MEEIKAVHDQIEDQPKVYNVLAKEFKIKARSVRNNWFRSSLAEVPEKDQKKVLRILTRELKKEQKNLIKS